MALVRVRQHVNPLHIQFQIPAAAPQWDQVFADPMRPLHLDIGCARGKFVQQMAQLEPDWNYLGLEIRAPLVEQANQWAQELGLGNLHYLFCNANNSLQPILATLPAGILQRVSIQFPDPWFKVRHQKRRVVQPELVADLAQALAPGATVFVQSDILPVALQMRDRFEVHGAFRLTQPEWLVLNPMPVPTEREVGVIARGEAVYRAVFVRVEG